MSTRNTTTRTVLSIVDQNTASLRDARATLTTFFLKHAPRILASLLQDGPIQYAAPQSQIEEGLANVKKNKDATGLEKALLTAIYALIACGYNTLERIAKLATDRKTVTQIAQRAVQFMSVYALIFKLYEAGVRHSLESSRALFRSIFERTGDAALKPAQAKLALFCHIAGLDSVSDRTFQYFVLGYDRIIVDRDGNEFPTEVQSRIKRYETAVKYDRENKTNLAERAKFTRMDIEAFEDYQSDFDAETPLVDIAQSFEKTPALQSAVATAV